jgi:hypothetical protein
MTWLRISVNMQMLLKMSPLDMHNYFSLPQMFSDLYSRKMNSCSTNPHNGKGMPANFAPKMQKLKTNRKCIFSLICTSTLHQVIMWMMKETRQSHYALKVTPATWVLLTGAI